MLRAKLTPFRFAQYFSSSQAAPECRVFGRRNPSLKTFDIIDPSTGDVRSIEFVEGSTILEAALDERVEIPTSCGGMGTCGACRIFIIDPPLSLKPRNEIEKEFASERGFVAEERLACQVQACAGLKVRVSEG